ncbi:MAG: aspartate carbamoyltransferase catalytic subunit [Clostridiales bacterium]|nr:aspartate carbamoyltransferase catalytic subunit [Clostridiales bacterium]
MRQTALHGYDILGLKDMSKDTIDLILHTTAKMKALLQQGKKDMKLLSGKSVAIVFYENSTRTRLSFELAAKYLGTHVVSMSEQGSSVAKGESLEDTLDTIAMMAADAIVIRHPHSGAPAAMALKIDVPIINAGDGMNEHPTQALLDMYTMLEYKGRLDGLKVAIIGDIYHSRVARSNIWGLTKMGAQVVVAGPPTLLPKDIEAMGAQVSLDVEYAIKDADVVMGLRMQRERQNAGLVPSLAEYTRYFGINAQRLAMAKSDAILMHPRPANIGVEISADIINGPQSVISQQVANGVAVRMALLYLILGGGNDIENTD